MRRSASPDGLPLNHLIGLSENSDRSCSEALILVQQHLAAVEEKLTQLQTIQNALLRMADTCQTCCPGAKAPDCTIVEALAGNASIDSHPLITSGIWEPETRQ
ncbi:hypothetical protein CW309_32010 [Pseudomonas hunanensis]|nr:hypothetical protein CW309_32010 [Pseudomonas hunanensis]